MKIDIVKDIVKAKLLWEKFSPYETVWDEWGFIAPLFHVDQFEPYFLVLVDDDGQELGLWPLWLEKELGRYYAFGGDYLEDIRFWFPLEYFPFLVANLPSTKLFDVNAQAAEQVIKQFPEYKNYFQAVHHRYFLEPAKFNYSVTEYLQTFSKKHRYNLLRDLKKLQDLHYELAWELNEHFDDFVKFNLERFGEESDFIEPLFIEEMREIIQYLVDQQQLRTLVIKINGVVVGLELACEFKGIWYVLNAGQASGFDNLGKLLIMEHIKEAFSRRCKEVDFLAGDTGWKQLWNLDREQYYNFATPDYIPVDPDEEDDD
ncbi:MAG: GNAT family N-acetyltransferase [Candidatus Komeilibacteria bacterium]|nr:GNAT family N-acetyltransferase [Candidatus Komeilibacteria bacterium]